LSVMPKGYHRSRRTILTGFPRFLYSKRMTIELPGTLEERLQDLAARQGREIGVLVEEAIEEYLEAAAITDLDATEISEAQMALMGELGGITE
jgi:predicted DNA-binding protein